MKRKPEKQAGTKSPIPRKHTVPTRENRDAEIRLQAEKDVQNVMGSIRVVLRKGLRTNE